MAEGSEASGSTGGCFLMLATKEEEHAKQPDFLLIGFYFYLWEKK